MNEFEVFYCAYYQRLLNILIFLAAGDVDLAKDAVAEAMTVAYEKWDSINNPPAYVRQVAINWMIKERRRARRAIPTPPDEIGEKPDDITGQTIWADRSWVIGLLEQLPPAQREVMACIVDEYKPAEIADLLGKTPAAVRQNLSAARRRLREHLGYGEEAP
jgi:RNA polymerase sigma factor (sigma-70 family)